MNNQQQLFARRNEGGKPYYYKGYKIGLPSWNWETFILWRKSTQKPRRYPNTIGISTSILKDLIEKGNRLIVVTIDRKAKYRSSPHKWIDPKNSIIDSLKKGQEPHAFMPIRMFQKIGD